MPNNGPYDFTMRRLGLLMEPEPGNPDEAMGVLNPAAVRGRDGALYLFPRDVAEGNFSRIGKARVCFNDKGDPDGVERLGIALSPTPHYERHGSTGGCEDPRITHFRPLDTFLMTYTAWGPSGPRIALAVSKDLEAWERRGRVDFIPDPNPVYETNFDVYHNKDGVVFPEAVPDPEGRPSLALLHRPVYETAPGTSHDIPPGVDDPMPSIWISYCPLEDLKHDLHGRLPLHHHTVLADPEFRWEAQRIGAGPPPILTKHGWLLVYHGVSGNLEPMIAEGPVSPPVPPPPAPPPGDVQDIRKETKKVAYRAGVMLLDAADPRRILYRTTEPVLEPQGEAETDGIVSNVVFPTGIDVRTDIGQPRRVDVYYGMADSRVGVATFNLPE